MLKILIVDDEQIERRGLKLLIKKNNFDLDVAEAENGETAYEYLTSNPIDILLTDIKMPFMDGMELSKKSRILYPNLKIIIFSAYAEFEYAKKAINFNAFHYLLKPVDINEFKKVFTDVIAICKKEQEDMELNKKMLAAYNKISSVRRKHYTFKNFKNSNFVELKHFINPEHDSLNKKTLLSKNDKNKKVIEDILKLIEENYMRDISLEWIAEKVYLSPSYLSYLFKKETGKSLIKYITLYRLEKAKSLLKNTNMKIVDIVKKVGYEDQSYFCSNFKNYCGISPAKFRELSD